MTIGDPTSGNGLIRLGLAKANGNNVEIAPLGWAVLAVVAFLLWRHF